ncbi:MAG: ribosome rescue protein RqcH, partial [Promethearchaeota archaeon]
MFRFVKEFSNFDVFAIVKELDLLLTKGSISNVYEVKDLLILKIKTNLGKKNLIIKKDSRINLTEYEYPIPEFPNQYIRTLRKFLKNRRILGVYQHKFDRIIIIELTNVEEGSWKFVIELFNKGNFLLLDQNEQVIVAKRYKKFRERNILPKKKYEFPKSQEKDFFTINKEDFKLLFKNSDNEIVRDISRKLKFSGLYSEEICYTAKVDKKTHSNKLNDEDLNSLYNSFKKARNQLLFGLIDAHIILDQQGNELVVLPFEIEILKDFEKRKFPSFNEAVDEFFSKLDYETIRNPKDQKINNQIIKLEKILQDQENYLEVLRLKKEKNYEIGDFMYSNMHKFDNLVSVISDARRKEYKWDEINDKLKNAKKENVNGSEFFNRIIPSTNQLLITVKGTEVYLDLRKSIGENVNSIYSKGKKAERKLKGTISAIRETKDKIEKLHLKKDLLEDELNFLIKKPKKKWYEKFRWFETTDGFLVIGGRDASSNEIIFKKYITPGDKVFHTNIPGSPLVVVKNPENKEIPPRTFNEAAEFTASYSRAWKENWGVVDVFYVRPNQVTKTPPTGEYLQKGSFIISGKKDIIKNSKTQLTIGLKLVEVENFPSDQGKILYPKLICGPEQSVKRFTDNSITVLPTKSSNLTKGKLAKDIKS